jgi:uncharacterized membrane protein
MSLRSGTAPLEFVESSRPRLALVDALRGLAVAQMIVYHFLYDLDYFGWLELQMLSDPRWIAWRTLIVTQFLLLVGVGLVLRQARNPGDAAFSRRWLQVAAAAAIVSIGSYLVFGPRFIWFGILHFIAVALILARPLVRVGRANGAVGLALVAIGLIVSHPWFDPAPWSALGLVTKKPQTEDYVPLLPWFGVVLIGVALASEWRDRRFAIAAPLAVFAAAPPRWLTVLGTWALTVYLVHQPILMGILSLVRRIAS